MKSSNKPKNIMYYSQDMTRALPQGGENAEDAALMRQLETAAHASLNGLREASEKGELKPFLRVARDTEDMKACEALAKHVYATFDHLVLVGTGGSSLGAKALSVLAEDDARAPTLHLLENVDPHTTQRVLETIDPAKTFCLLISKSGNTVEVLANTHVLLAHFTRTLGQEAIKDHFLAITEPKSSPLKDISRHFGMPTLDHDPHIGGRYSVLSLVGLLPAAMLGLDVHALRRGAAQVLEHALVTREVAENYPALGATLQTYHMRRGRPIHVLMPYCDRLATFSYWYRQLVAESLGKEHTGITPLASFGAVDQHSMLQLYNDGQADKQFTFITLDQTGQGPVIAPVKGVESLPHIMGKTIGDMMMAMHHGTIQSVAAHGHPLRVLRVRTVDEATLGALMMHFMLETIISGELMQIDPFNQPAVEESKRFAREYLERTA